MIDWRTRVPKISVALCTHNGADYIQEQIRSICRQSFLPCEIVLSDDASIDTCVADAQRALADCQRDNPSLDIPMRVIKNARPLGVTRNFSQAMLHCRGDFIALCDQDDVWHFHRLRRMVDEFESRPGLLLLHTNARLVDAECRTLGGSLFHALEVKPVELKRIHRGDAFAVFLRRNLVTGATTIFRRSLLAYAAPIPIQWLHDEWLAIIAAAVGEVDVLEEELIDYRQHGGNQIGARRDTFLRKVQMALASRGYTHHTRTVKAELLLARLLQIGNQVSADMINDVHRKVEHQRFRSELPANRLARVIPVMREALTGRYGRFGRGTRGVVRDLFESI